MPGGGSGNHWWCRSVRLNAGQSVCHYREAPPQDAGGNLKSAFWDVEKDDIEACQRVSGGQGSYWHPQTD